jgi:hypothetical protein
MLQTFASDEKMKAAEAVSRLIDDSPAAIKIEIVKSERGFSLTSWPLTTEDEVITKS